MTRRTPLFRDIQKLLKHLPFNSHIVLIRNDYYSMSETNVSNNLVELDH